MKRLMTKAALAATMTTGFGAALSVPGVAQAQSIPAPTMVIYGKQKCPTDSDGNEIVVCVRRAPGEQFRIPKELRELKVTPENESWAAKIGGQRSGRGERHRELFQCRAGRCERVPGASRSPLQAREAGSQGRPARRRSRLGSLIERNRGAAWRHERTAPRARKGRRTSPSLSMAMSAFWRLLHSSCSPRFSSHSGKDMPIGRVYRWSFGGISPRF